MNPRDLARQTCAQATDKTDGAFVVVVIAVDPGTGVFSLSANLGASDRFGLVSVLRSALDRAEVADIHHAGAAADLARSDG